MIARILLAIIINIATCVNVFTQVFHHKTGQVIPTSKVDTVLWKKGVFNGYTANYGTLIVKETTNKNSNRITIPVIHIPSFNGNPSLHPVFILNGGPGESNLRNELIFDTLLTQSDIVLMGYRGVDGSTVLDCPEFKKALFLSELTIANSESTFESAFLQCVNQWSDKRIDIQGYTMDYVISDLDVLRECMGFESINILSFSFGSILTQLYHNYYPIRINSAVMISARPLGDFIFSTDIIEKQLKYFGYSIFGDENFSSNIVKYINGELITKNNTVLRSLFVFGSLYSNEGLVKLQNGLQLYYEGDQSEINEAINTFKKNFPGEMVIGDMLLKKQGRLYSETIKNDNLFQDFVSGLNSWYSYSNTLFPDIEDDFIIDSVPVLFISNQYDIASPFELVESELLNKYPNASLYNIPGTGHLDLFFNSSIMDSTQNRIMQYYNDNE